MLKYYLRGLGIGIVVTTVILTVVFNLRGRMSDSQIKERAAKLGMVMAEPTEDSLFSNTSSDNGNTTADGRDDKQTSETDETAETTPAEQGAQTTPEATKEPAATEPETEEATPEPTTPEPTTPEPTTPEPATPEPTTPEPTTPEPPAPSVGSVNIEIRSGMYSEAVSRLLFETGIIPNAAEFNLYLENNGFAERIAVGTFMVSSDMSYEQLARIITRS
ncbi:MAG: hypothetical protein NC223_04980 [Butyrivibrio sp.]|nr:hypothetical protein [Butyrivibrio sp.]